MAELLNGVLWALGMLRSRSNSRDAGEPVPVEGDYTAALKGLDRLPARVRAVQNAVICSHASAGGTPRRLAT
ncbi:hypothetical protein [Streptomyces swartbergensis]|uniref:Uncharacterized protein n=1 Tax=Streptomyces swartbergensis TaxID=487165 RepID=A0A243S891_9ACTN|nr:hypothetical protein [Streptomyces swartbergensis]OUD03879.1 hypothetical protein CA983_07205 [Streptomyces swartbergensis]